MNKYGKIAIRLGIAGVGMIIAGKVYESKISETGKRRMEQSAKIRKLVEEFAEYDGKDVAIIKQYTDSIRKEMNKYAELF